MALNGMVVVVGMVIVVDVPVFSMVIASST